MGNMLELLSDLNLLDFLHAWSAILVQVVHAVFMVSVILVLIVLNKRLKVLENLPSVKDFLRSHYAKKRQKHS